MAKDRKYHAAIYCRLSRDDGTEFESSSIATQKTMLEKYVKERGWHVHDIYVDDGYSGTSFDRPAFQRMIEDIEKGGIDCVITKDLSRLGRNYLDCGLYLEVFFPEHGVRYIAVNDGVDTANRTAMDITPFRNILNEMYASDVSVKVRSAYRTRFSQGRFMGTYAPYGYRKDPADHTHLLIDENVSHVVRKIFDLALAGDGIARIRKYLNANHILRPSAYAASQGVASYDRYFEGNEENRYIWSENGVRGILRNPVYAGNLAGFKRTSVNMKSKKRPSTLPEEWEVVENTHEGIVTQEEFDTVQRLMTSRRIQKGKSGYDNIFAGLIKCADCGYAMRAMSAHRRKRAEVLDCVTYSCNNYGRYGNIMCSAHSIEARDLYEAVLADINRFAKLAVKNEVAVRKIGRKLADMSAGKQTELVREERQLTKRLAEIDRLFAALYEDKVMEKITQRNYELLTAKYEAEQADLQSSLSRIRKELSQRQEKEQNITDFIETIKGYAGLKELDATVLNTLIDKILISERVKGKDGKLTQDIEIHYKFIGSLEELHISPTERYMEFNEKRICEECGGEYTAKTPVAKYCSDCREKVVARQRAEIEERRRKRRAAGA